MSIDPVSLLIVILPVKAIAYFLAIRLALSHFGHPSKNPNSRAAALLGMRLLIGLLFLFPLWALSSDLSVFLGETTRDRYVGYLVVYGALRWVAWSIVSLWIFVGPRIFISVVIGGSRGELLWRCGVVTLSFAFDLPVLISNEGPIIGKFFC